MVHIDTVLHKMTSRIVGRHVPKANYSKFIWRVPMHQNFPSLYPAVEERKRNEQNVSRMLFALEPPKQTLQLDDRSYDAVFIHRPFDLHVAAFPQSYILWSHDAFDNNMTVGYNKVLAADLTIQKPLQKVHWENKRGVTRCIGMVGSLESVVPFETFNEKVSALFDGCEASKAHDNTHVTKVAVMGAFNADLLKRMKSEHNVDLYITGQVRAAAMEVAEELGMAVIAVGHDRCEYYGLKALANSVCHVSADPTKLIKNLKAQLVLADGLTLVT